MRLFFALDLPVLHREWLGLYEPRVAQSLGSAAGPLRWSHPEQWHLTLQFLGDYPPSSVPALSAALRSTAESFTAFRLSLGDLGTFRGPRMGALWVGVREGKEDLESLVKTLQHELESIGFRLEKRPFRGHVTLARARQSVAAELLQTLPAPATPCPSAYVDRIILFESELQATGARYTRLAEAPLRFITKRETGDVQD